MQEARGQSAHFDKEPPFFEAEHPFPFSSGLRLPACLPACFLACACLLRLRTVHHDLIFHLHDSFNLL
jgi:hypothetical protein